MKNITNAYCELTRSCIAFTLFFPGLFNLYLCRSAFTRALVSSSKALDALDHARRTWSLHVSIWAMKRSQPKQRRFVRVILSLDSDSRTRRKRYAGRVLNDMDRIGQLCSVELTLPAKDWHCTILQHITTHYWKNLPRQFSLTHNLLTWFIASWAQGKGKWSHLDPFQVRLNDCLHDV